MRSRVVPVLFFTVRFSGLLGTGGEIRTVAMLQHLGGIYKPQFDGPVQNCCRRLSMLLALSHALEDVEGARPLYSTFLQIRMQVTQGSYEKTPPLDHQPVAYIFPSIRKMGYHRLVDMKGARWHLWKYLELWTL